MGQIFLARSPWRYVSNESAQTHRTFSTPLFCFSFAQETCSIVEYHVIWSTAHAVALRIPILVVVEFWIVDSNTKDAKSSSEKREAFGIRTGAKGGIPKGAGCTPQELDSSLLGICLRLAPKISCGWKKDSISITLRALLSRRFCERRHREQYLSQPANDAVGSCRALRSPSSIR
jgi:hypothetical protein